MEAGLLRIDPFMRIEQVQRLWREYELALQRREMAVSAETTRLERLQRAGEKIERECGSLRTHTTALEKRMNEVLIRLLIMLLTIYNTLIMRLIMLLIIRLIILLIIYNTLIIQLNYR